MRLRAFRDRLGRLDPWEKTAVAVWAGILLVLCGRLLATSRGQGVYPIFTAAARHWLDGQDLYDGPGEPFRYSPLVAALFVPLSALPSRLGGILWRLVEAGVLLGGLAWWCRAVLPLTPRRRAIFFLLVAALSVGNLNNGQSNPLVLGLLLGAGAAVARYRWDLVSGCLALACLLKLYPIAAGLLLAAAYPRRLARRLAVAVGLGLALPLLLGPPDYVMHQYARWFHHLLTDDRQMWPVAGGYRDVRMLFRLWGKPLSAEMFLTMQLVAAALIAGLCLAQRRGEWPHRRLLILALGLSCCWMTLLGPATESCTYVLIAPVLAGALLENWGDSGSLAGRGVLFGSCGLFLASQMMLWFPWGARFNNLGVQPVAGLLLFGYLLATAARQAVRAGQDAWFARQGRLERAGRSPYDRAA
jgi:hypothetical protein